MLRLASIIAAFTLVTAAAGQGLGGSSQPPPGRSAAAPQQPLAVEPALIDFGISEPGAEHPGAFTLRNVSGGAVQIVDAIPSCKCTDVQGVKGKTLQPGESIQMQATMKAPNVPGVKDASVQLVLSADGRTMAVPAKLRCEVRMALRVVEEYINALDRKQPGGSKAPGATSGSLHVESTDGRPFRILSSNGQPPDFVGFDPASDEPRAKYEVQWDISKLGCEEIPTYWIFETDRPECPILPCEVRHECTGMRRDPQHRERKWLFGERIVNAGALKAGVPATITLETSNSEPKAGPSRPKEFSDSYKRIGAVRSTSPQATAKLISVRDAGDEAQVTVQFTPEASARGMIYVLLEVESPTGAARIPVVARVIP